ncbi:N-6 DNA methylase, partial [Candidatus Borrarchaeum sp.]|uniref:N-6 DNA methylase n=1 Tax=Candidatus Borrarchaeum sp. TaxID=2846742 RepID=UPI00257A6240
VVRMAVEILDPQPYEHIVDPACGSGGFLIFAMEHVWQKLKIEAKRKNWSTEMLQKRKTEIASKFFGGIDKDMFLAKVTKAYMALIGDGRGGIFCENSLEFPEKWQATTQQRIMLGKFDVLFTNPPFGSKITIKKSLYSQFELSFKWNKNKKTGKWKKGNKQADKRPPQVLFIERCLQFLAPNGRMAIVLPDGLLSNPSDGYITQYIKDNAEIIGLVDLPMSTFLPNTPTKTHILFLRKKKPEGNYPIFMAYAKTCGHDKRGKIIYKVGEAGQNVVDDDIYEISKHFARRYERVNKYDRKGFLVYLDDLKSGILLPKYYNPELNERLEAYRQTGEYDVYSIGDLVKLGKLWIRRGHEVGSVNYGTGDIPFIRTSEISNWELTADPTHCLAEDIYEEYKDRQKLKKDDILIINDGTYLMGRTAILSENDTKIVVQSHIRILTVLDREFIHPYLLLFLLGLRIVQEQIESKSFRQATISTLGNRLLEIRIPLPKDEKVRKEIVEQVSNIVEKRSMLRHKAMNIEFNGTSESVMGIKNKATLGNL